ncbi:VanZ family protein [Pseudoneobacillus sp. C159]
MLRTISLISWAGLIFLFTCTESMEHLIHQGKISFAWNAEPNFAEFLYPLPNALDTQFILRKLGHAVSFFIFTLLLYLNHLPLKFIISLNLYLSILTETLQLFLHRGGRLFDIGFDLLGSVAGLLVILSMYLLKSKNVLREG